jgi:hypothetical protein
MLDNESIDQFVQRINHKKFFDLLFALRPPVGADDITGRAPLQTVMDEIKKIRGLFVFRFNDPNEPSRVATAVRTVTSRFTTLEPQEYWTKDFSAPLINHFNQQLVNVQKQLQGERLQYYQSYQYILDGVKSGQHLPPGVQKAKPETIPEYCYALQKCVSTIQTSLQANSKLHGLPPSASDKPKRRDDKKRKRSSSKEAHASTNAITSGNTASNSMAAITTPAKSPKTANKIRCTGCGKAHKDVCLFVKHPDYNKSKVSFLNSVKGKQYAALKVFNLISNKRLAPDGLSLIDYSPPADVQKALDRVYEVNHPIDVITTNMHNCNFVKNIHRQAAINGPVMQGELSRKPLSVLLDTGAVTHSFVNEYFLTMHDNIKMKSLASPLDVQLANGKSIKLINYVVLHNLKLFKDNQYKRIPYMTAVVMPNLSYDMIIGFPDIFANNLVTHFASVFSKDQHAALSTFAKHTTLHGDTTDDDTIQAITPLVTRKCNVLAPLSSSVHLDRPMSIHDSQYLYTIKNGPYHVYEDYSTIVNAISTPIAHGPHNLSRNAPPQRASATPSDPTVTHGTVHRSELLDGEPDDDNIQDTPRHDLWTAYFNEAPRSDPASQPASDLSVADIISMLHIEGTQSFKQSLTRLVSKYKQLFSTSVSKEPARLSPLALEVDAEKWDSLRFEKYARPQSPERQEAVKAFINQALKDGLIRKSDARQFSQVLLTKKPNGTWRFCVDYRRLNLLTKALGWPLQNIESLLLRIGEHRPKFFATLDLTSGFYQTSIAEHSRRFTAFITSMGVYEWCRSPMGPKSVPSYFQKQLQTVVLKDLISSIVELYIDDLITWAQTEEELINNLEQVFIRFDRYNIVINPKKCKFGMTTVEYLGHTLDSTGLHFSSEKLETVEKFRLPDTLKELRSFLGIASYFRSHVAHHAELSKPLHEMIPHKDYKPKQRIEWTTRQAGAFEDLRKAVSQ